MPRKSKAEKRREDIERVAWDIYASRYKPDTRLNKDELWKEADKIVRSPIRTALFASHRPLVKLEKGLWEPLLAWANNQATLSLLGLIGNLGLIIAVFTYIGSEKQRRDAEVLNAWQTITSAYGQSGSGGRMQALEFLNASPGANWRRKFPWVCAPLRLCVWESEDLGGINLSVPDKDGPGVFLAGVNLERAILVSANLEGAFLGGANLEGAFLDSANLESTILWLGNLKGARLRGTILKGTRLERTNLEGAFLESANLEGAFLEGANLGGAHLFLAKLEGADLSLVNLKGADLSLVNLEEALNLTQDQLSQALLCHTTLPDDITLDPNRDCEAVGIDPKTGRPIDP